ncbi:Ribonucleases P/MRP protein subunit pop1 [Exophiala oligosperma]
MQSAGQKRKAASAKQPQASKSRKRQKYFDSRAISVEPTNAVLPANGELNVASFLRAREFEIGALERSMQRTRDALSQRAFQQVPRHMRRRTASHNAKKVPKRLRGRAEREMKDDNTPTVTKRTRTPSKRLRLRLGTAKRIQQLTQQRKTVRRKKKEAKANAKQTDPEKHVSIERIPRVKKNTLAKPPKATVKFQRRQVNKTWLPTHLWHAKRAHMTRPIEPLWKLAIPLRPTEKSYRPSHRAAGAHGCVAWDVSYMSTVSCHGTQPALDSMLNALGFSPKNLSPSLHKKWKSGTRFAEGWVYERDGIKKPVSPVQIIWVMRPNYKSTSNDNTSSLDAMDVDEQNGQAGGSMGQTNRKSKLDHHILMRLHPAAFHQLWEELLKVAKMQKPQVLVEDLRFEIGSIDVQGPGSTEALLGVLRPFVGTENQAASTWKSLAGLNNPASLPQNAALSFDVIDPRLNYPPKRTQINPDNTQLDELLVSWPVDKSWTPSTLTSHRDRWRVCDALPSQGAINRRKALAPPGQSPALTPKDPQIPVILLASRAEKGFGSNCGNPQGTWTVLLPWKCVDPLWRSLMYYPLSTGGTPRFGGLYQKQQLAFELQAPWFPGDFPGTEAGKAWERTESEKRFDQWIRRPPKHRVAWDRLDLGLGRRGEIGCGWACDWEFLFQNLEVPEVQKVPNQVEQHVHESIDEPLLLTQRQRKAAVAVAQVKANRDAGPQSQDESEMTPPLVDRGYTQLSLSASISLCKKPNSAAFPSVPGLMTVRIMLLHKGSPTPAARIYRLPSIPRPANSTEGSKMTNTDPESQGQDQPQSWSSEPPPAQPPPATSTTDSSVHADAVRDLRALWIALDVKDDVSHTNVRLPKQKTNKFGLPRAHRVYDRESLAHINVLPKNASQEIIDQFGPNSAFGRGDGEIPKGPQVQAKAVPTQKGRGKAKAGAQAQTETQGDKKQGESVYLDADDDAGISAPLEAFQDLIDSPPLEDEWSKHPPCPDAHDLIGFVTSGGYNLAEGRGTAVGSIWAQRLVEGWKHDDDLVVKTKEQERRARLCIVRNAGESIGRLGIWEICG